MSHPYSKVILGGFRSLQKMVYYTHVPAGRLRRLQKALEGTLLHARARKPFSYCPPSQAVPPRARPSRGAPSAS